MMTPPRLTLVSRNDDIEDSRRDEPEAAEAVELARALSETEPQTTPAFSTRPGGREKLPILEARVFPPPEPLDEQRLASHLGPGEAIADLMEELQKSYAARGVNLVRTAGKWAFRTAADLS